MTKEELEKEAIKYAVDYPTSYGKGYKHKDLRIAYLAGAEPREKQIEIDAKQIRALQKQNGELTDELTKKADTNHQLVEQLAKLNERCSEFEITVGTLRTFSNEQAACIERLAKENAKLKDVIEGYKKIAKWCDNCDKIAKLEKENAELKSENQKWKDEWQEKVQEATDEGYARTLQTMQLNKAKQFIRDFLSVAVDYIDKEDKNYSLIEEGQQLLREVEK